MRKISGIVISLPMLIAPMVTLQLKPALAGEIGPAGAVEILSQSGAVDEKCGYLSAADHDELAGYAAKAEIAAAASSGVSTARNARQNGASRGREMACGDGSRQMVEASLDAARRAMAYAEDHAARQAEAKERAKKAQAEAAARAQASQQARARVAPTPERKPEVASASSSATASAGAAPAAGLNAYLQLTTAYYIERRCHHLRHADAMAFWHSIVARHNEAVRSFGTGAVARAKANAESAASRQACGNRTATWVKQSYTAIQ